MTMGSGLHLTRFRGKRVLENRLPLIVAVGNCILGLGWRNDGDFCSESETRMLVTAK